MKTHAAPSSPLSHGPPTMAVLPSAERDTDQPWKETKEAPGGPPTSLGPCWVQTDAMSRDHIAWAAYTTLDPEFLPPRVVSR